MVSMHRLVQHARSNAVAYLALFVALGGTSYAAVEIPRGSVGAAQIRNHSITPVKFNPSEINGSVRAWAIVGADGHVIAGAGKPTVTTAPGVPGNYDIHWGVTLPRTCATVANVDLRSPSPTESVPIPGGTTEGVVAGYVSEVSSGTTTDRAVPSGHISSTGLNILNQAGQLANLAFDVAVIC